jgi:hypothetical protein
MAERFWRFVSNEARRRGIKEEKSKATLVKK